MSKITKVLSLGILFLFVANFSLSAQKCKYDYDKADPITGEASKGNTFTIWTYMGSPVWKMGFNKTGDTYYAGMYLRYGGNLREIIQKGDPISFKLSNGDVVTITAQDEFVPAAQATQYGIITVYNGKYTIDAATLQQISENPPTYVRMNIESRVYEREISAKDGKKIAAAAGCILQ